MASASAGMMPPGIEALSPVSAAIRPSIEPLPNSGHCGAPPPLGSPVRAKGVRQVELSWILEDNRPMRNVIEALGAVPRAYARREEMVAALAARGVEL